MSTHKGGCHCGRIAFEFTGEVAEALECNCSLCAKRGALLHFVPMQSFTLKTPREKLGTYHFNKNVIDHHYCPDCGISPFSEGDHPKGGRIAAINLRCVDDVDVKALKHNFHNGRAD